MRAYNSFLQKIASVLIIFTVLWTIKTIEAFATSFDTRTDSITITEDLSRDEVANLIQNKINQETSQELVFIEHFTPKSNNKHYRVEFRLNVFSEAVGYAYKYGNSSLDIIIWDDIFDKNNVRIYLDNATLDECCEILKTITPLLDKYITEEDMANTVNHIMKHGEIYGYPFYTELNLSLLGSNNKGYRLMLGK